MRFEPFQYMRYAKRMEYADGVFMAGSGMRMPPEDLLGFKDYDFNLTSLCANYGDPRNVAKLAEHYGCGGEHIVMTAGSSEANFLAFACVLSPGDKVLVETPGYPQFRSLASFVHAEFVELPRLHENDFVPDLETYKSLLDENTRLVVLTNLHNPTMALIPRDTMAEMVRLAAEVGAHVLVDEVYLDHLKPGDNDTSVWGLGDNVIVTNSLTKVYGLGNLRFGWAVAPAKLAARMLDLLDVVDPELPAIQQNLGFRALENLARLRPLARRLHEQNWPIMREWIEARPDITGFTPPGGITAWVRIDGVEETGNLVTICRGDYGVLVVPGEYFQSPGWLRVSYSQDPTTLRDGLERLGKAIDDFRAHH